MASTAPWVAVALDAVVVRACAVVSIAPLGTIGALLTGLLALVATGLEVGLLALLATRTAHASAVLAANVWAEQRIHPLLR